MDFSDTFDSPESCDSCSNNSGGICRATRTVSSAVTRKYSEFYFYALRVKLLNETATPLSKAHEGDAGFDMACSEFTVVPARGKQLVKTDLAMAIPQGWYGRIAPRSSVAWKHHIDVGAGVVDSTYRGEVKVVLFNHSDVDFKIEVGDRIAQLIIERCMNPPVEIVDSLDDSDRGFGGFGSSGK